MPNQPVYFHLDYLKLNIFDHGEAVMNLVESALLERAGLPLGGWIDKGSADRWEHIYIGPGPVTLLVPKDSRITYTIVELKGQACATIGAFAIKAFLSYLKVLDVRWHGLRVDPAFDYVAFGPQLVYDAIKAGNINSRCLGVDDRDWHENAEGQTAYLGGRGQRKTRRLRVYNRRGYNRAEGELRGDWAKSAVRQFADTPLEEWPQLAMGHLRGIVDFVHRSADKRADRCPLLPWWKDFIGDVVRITNLPEEDRRKTSDDQKRHIIGQMEGRLQHCAKMLWPILEAFGAEYVASRIRYHVKDRINDEMRALAELLKNYRGCGLAGLNEDPGDDEAPF